MSQAIKAAIDELIVASAMLIDRDDLDGWLNRFEDHARYIVTSRENRELGLPAALIHCDSKASLVDRIAALRHANKFNPHYDRHIMGGSLITEVAGDVATVESNFMIVQSTKTGQSRLF
ncbi:MAG: anthranilate 1,2-dioxygenase, partial [Alphaproteobacteria bacterium]|nr:anthranilate 1,2-dioxygenase [Alphaproteobacteria bacterium]